MNDIFILADEKGGRINLITAYKEKGPTKITFQLIYRKLQATALSLKSQNTHILSPRKKYRIRVQRGSKSASLWFESLKFRRKCEPSS